MRTGWDKVLTEAWSGKPHLWSNKDSSFSPELCKTCCFMPGDLRQKRNQELNPKIQQYQWPKKVLKPAAKGDLREGEGGGGSSESQTSSLGQISKLAKFGRL